VNILKDDYFCDALQESNQEEWQSWFNAPVLKTGVGNTTGGSNPSSSAQK
jgi:hypothetical protein